MNKTAVSDLKPGMLLAESIFADNGTILVAEGTPLSEGAIKRLQEKSGRFVHIYDEQTIEADPGEILVKRVLAMATSKLSAFLPYDLYDGADSGLKVKFIKINDLLKEILSDNKVADFMMDLRTIDKYTLEHSINVCIFSLLVGIGLELPENLMKLLGTGGLLHDVGKLQLPVQIRPNMSRVVEKDSAAFQEHTSHGYQMLREKGFEATIAKIALYHHERWDGGGYPTQMVGEKIDLLSRIVNISDVYDSLTSPGATNRNLPHEAIEYLYGAGGIHFDARIVRGFIYNVAIYPLGSVVKLSTGEVGIVVNVAKNISSRPIVKICYDKDNHKLNYCYQLDLYQEKTVFITEVLL